MRRPRRNPVGPEAPDDPRAARLAALKLLNRRDYGAAELGRRLLERGFARPAADAAVAGLVAEKLVDDVRFAEHFVAYHAGRGQGPALIAHRLREAGVAPGTIDAALDAASADWRRRCEQVRRKRFGAKAPETWAERGRQARFLTQRGFRAGDIRAAVGGDLEEN